MTYLHRLARRIEAQVPVELVPPDSSGLFLLYAVLVRAKRNRLNAEDVHDAWVAWMEMRGEDHPSMVEFGLLRPEIQREDEPFVAALRAAAAELDSD